MNGVLELTPYAIAFHLQINGQNYYRAWERDSSRRIERRFLRYATEIDQGALSGFALSGERY